MRNRRRAAEGQRSTSTDQTVRESARVVEAAELCGEGLRTFGRTNECPGSFLVPPHAFVARRRIRGFYRMDMGRRRFPSDRAIQPERDV